METVLSTPNGYLQGNYKHALKQKSMVLLDIKSDLNLETTSAAIMALVWILIIKFVVAYSGGSNTCLFI